MSDIRAVNLLCGIFEKYHKFELALNEVLIGEGDLTDLCQTGIDFLKNPLYVHDNMFCILALPQYVAGMREFDVDRSTGRSYIPLWLVNDFKFDEEYQKTLSTHGAQYWGNEQYPRDFRCLYVNIWDGSYYMGRLIIEEMRSSITPGQLIVAEYFARFVREIMLREMKGNENNQAIFDGIFRNMVSNSPVDPETYERFLKVLNWKESDSYICIKTVSQNTSLAVKSDNSLRSTYAELFRSFFCFYNNDQCFLIVNLTRSDLRREDVDSLLAPVIRESYMYAGLSYVFHDLRNAYQAFRQVDFVLSEIPKNPGKWVNSFDRCVLDYMINGVGRELSLNMLITPDLLSLIDYDKKNDSFLYLTLKTFLENERSIPRTSEQLSIHRSTLLYRLGKIEKFLKADLEDDNVRLYLRICFKILER